MPVELFWVGAVLLSSLGTLVFALLSPERPRDARSEVIRSGQPQGRAWPRPR